MSVQYTEIRDTEINSEEYDGARWDLYKFIGCKFTGNYSKKETRFSKTIFEKCDFEKVTFTYTNFSGSTFEWGTFVHARWDMCNLSCVDIKFVQMSLTAGIFILCTMDSLAFEFEKNRLGPNQTIASTDPNLRHYFTPQDFHMPIIYNVKPVGLEKNLPPLRFVETGPKHHEWEVVRKDVN